MKVHFISKIKSDLVSKERVVEIITGFLESWHLDQPELGIHVVGLDEMQTINKNYRKIDKPTDVISFPIDEPLKKATKQEQGELCILGDIFICPKYIKESSTDFDQELEKVIKHGLTHLLGFDHKTKQEQEKFDKIVNRNDI